MNSEVNLDVALPTCVLIATGGTVAMKVDPNLQAPVPTLQGEDLVRGIPRLRDVARFEVRNLCNIPSVEMGSTSWRALRDEVAAAVARRDVSGVIVTHGTDTLEESAWFIDLTVATSKPIVFVGAQRSASEPDCDGPRNIVAAARVCASSDARDRGVMVVMNDQVHAARDVTKAHTADVSGFTSGPLGVLGSVDPDRVVFRRAASRRQTVGLLPGTLARVDIVPMFAGADGTLMRAAADAGAKGIVVQAVGAGNVSSAVHDTVQEVIERGILVVIATRVHYGRTRAAYGFKGGGKSLSDAGAVYAGDLSPQKARILLMLALQGQRTRDQIRHLFEF